MDDLVIVSMGARRVELDCAGPPHWRGSPPFSGANAGSVHSTRRAVSVSCCCRFSLSLFSVTFLCHFSLFCSLAPFSLYLFFFCTPSPTHHFSSLFSHHAYRHSFTRSHTLLLASRSSPFFHLTFPCLFPLSLFSVAFPCFFPTVGYKTEFCSAKTF